jgi:hypothetical protein
MGRIEVLDDDKGQGAFLRNPAKKRLQGLQSAGGSADADNGKRWGAFRQWNFFAREVNSLPSLFVGILVFSSLRMISALF